MLAPPKQPRALSILRFTALLCAILITFWFCWTVVSFISFILRTEPTPSDDQLLTVFFEDPAAFEQLRKMLIEDRLNDVSIVIEHETMIEQFSRRPIQLSDQRREEYRSLIQQLGLKAIKGRADHRKRIWLVVLAEGTIGTVREKGFYYSLERPTPILNSLEHSIPPVMQGRNAVEGYRHIHQHWYLYYWSD